MVQGIAGSFYNKNPKLGWRTFDHILVSGGLLKPPAPYLDEAQTKVVLTEAMKGTNGMPCPFEMANGLGASDHLPIVRAHCSIGGRVVSTATADWENLLREAISQARALRPQAADDLVRVSQRLQKPS